MGSLQSVNAILCYVKIDGLNTSSMKKSKGLILATISYGNLLPGHGKATGYRLQQIIKMQNGFHGLWFLLQKIFKQFFTTIGKFIWRLILNRKYCFTTNPWKCLCWDNSYPTLPVPKIKVYVSLLCIVKC